MKTEILSDEEFGLEWIDLHAPTEAELADVATSYDLPLGLLEECLDGSMHHKYEEHGSTTFFLLRGFRGLDSGTNIEDLTHRIAILMNERVLVTLHRGAWEQILRIRELACSERPQLLGIAFSESLQSDIVYLTLKQVLESFEEPLDLFEERFESCEGKTISQESEPRIFSEAYTLKRQLFACHRALRMNLEVARKLETILHRHSKAVECIRADAERLLGVIDAEIYNLHNLMALQMSLLSNHTNEIMRVLAIFSAFFMPLSFIAGVYGMNFKYMPELEYRYGYVLAVVFMIVVSVLIYWYFRRLKWIGQSADLGAPLRAETMKSREPHRCAVVRAVWRRREGLF